MQVISRYRAVLFAAGIAVLAIALLFGSFPQSANAGGGTTQSFDATFRWGEPESFVEFKGAPERRVIPTELYLDAQAFEYWPIWLDSFGMSQVYTTTPTAYQVTGMRVVDYNVSFVVDSGYYSDECEAAPNFYVSHRDGATSVTVSNDITKTLEYYDNGWKTLSPGQSAIASNSSRSSLWLYVVGGNSCAYLSWRFDSVWRPDPTPTPWPTSTPTKTPTVTPTNTSTATPTQTQTPTLTPSPTATATSTSTATNTPSSTSTSTPTATVTPTSTPTQTSTNTPTSTPTATVSAFELNMTWGGQDPYGYASSSWTGRANPGRSLFEYVSLYSGGGSGITKTLSSNWSNPTNYSADPASVWRLKSLSFGRFMGDNSFLSSTWYPNCGKVHTTFTIGNALGVVTNESGAALWVTDQDEGPSYTWPWKRLYDKQSFQASGRQGHIYVASMLFELGSAVCTTLVWDLDRLDAPIPTATPTSTNTPTRTPTVTATNTGTATATVTQTSTSTPTPTGTATRTPTATVTSTNTPVPTATPIRHSVFAPIAARKG